MLQELLADYGLTVYKARGLEIASCTRRRDLFTRARGVLLVIAVLIMIGVLAINWFTDTNVYQMAALEFGLLALGLTAWMILLFVEKHLNQSQTKALVGVVRFDQQPVALLLLKIGAIRGTYQLLSVFGQGSLVQGLTLLACTESELPGVLLRNFQKPVIVSAATIEVSTTWEIGDAALANLYYAVGRAPDWKAIKATLQALKAAQTFPPR